MHEAITLQPNHLSGLMAVTANSAAIFLIFVEVFVDLASEVDIEF